MIAALATAGSAVANSRPLQIAIIGALFVALFMLWLKGRDDQIREMERMIGERKARIKQDEIRKRNDEKSAQVITARESVPSDITHSDGVPDSLSSVLFSD
jgi:type II secretory pathway pseudopilin PulG